MNLHMFKAAAAGLVWWPCDITRFDEAGEEVVSKVRFLFKPLTRSEANQRRTEVLKRTQSTLQNLAEQTDLSKPADLSTSAERIGVEATNAVLKQVQESFATRESDLALLIERTEDWRGFEGENGEPLPFSRELLTELLSIELFAAPVLAAFAECCGGAIAKNSKAGRAGTQA